MFTYGGGTIQQKFILALIILFIFFISINIENIYAFTDTNNTTNFTINEIKTATIRVKNITETYYTVPNYVEIASNQSNYQVTLPQFLQLVTDTILKINSGSKSTISLNNNINYPNNPLESFTKGVIYKNEYLKIAQSMKNFININNRVPNYISTSLGKMRYESLIYMYSKILNFHQVNNRLPNTVSMTPTTTSRPVFIVSDNINSISKDTARCNSIVSELQKLGITAKFYGLGPNYHISVLQNESIPKNALIVEMSGGACAGTIAEKTTGWYKKLVEDIKVAVILLNTATRITGLEWLPRAWDDNFSPSTFKGLARPDLLLLNNGYNYIEGISANDIASMVYFIVKEAII